MSCSGSVCIYPLLMIKKVLLEDKQRSILGKIKECKVVILWSKTHDFKIICPKGVQVSFHLLVGQTFHGFFFIYI